MDYVLYTGIGFSIIWCAKYVFIPLGVAILARIIVDKLLKPQPGKHKKKRLNKNRLEIKSAIKT
jgi:hypothetical protein